MQVLCCMGGWRAEGGSATPPAPLCPLPPPLSPYAWDPLQRSCALICMVVQIHPSVHGPLPLLMGKGPMAAVGLQFSVLGEG